MSITTGSFTFVMSSEIEISREFGCGLHHGVPRLRSE